MIDLMAIRTALATALADELGTYTFPDGQVTPAIAVDDGSGNYPPKDAKVTGLECIILLSPEVQSEDIFGGFKETYTAMVMLRQWDATKTTLDARLLARDAIASLGSIGVVPGSMRRTLPFEKLGNIETAQFTVFQSFLEAE